MADLDKTFLAGILDYITEFQPDTVEEDDGSDYDDSYANDYSWVPDDGQYDYHP